MICYCDVFELYIGYFVFDGVGVCLICVIGGLFLECFDLFLMFDQFDIQNLDDYVVGFFLYLYCGFEIVIYMFEGCMCYEDYFGNCGLFKFGGVQWMIVVYGIIYSEMLEQVEGVMCGFQLWVNLLVKSKLVLVGYCDIELEDVLCLEIVGGVKVMVIVGCFDDGQVQQIGVVERLDIELYYYDL